MFEYFCKLGQHVDFALISQSMYKDSVTYLNKCSSESLTL